MKTSAPTTTNAKPAPAARSRTTSASSPPSASKSPSPASPNRTPPEQTTRQPNPHHPFTRLRCALPGTAACPAGLSFSGQNVLERHAVDHGADGRRRGAALAQRREILLERAH